MGWAFFIKPGFFSTMNFLRNVIKKELATPTTTTIIAILLSLLSTIFLKLLQAGLSSSSVNFWDWKGYGKVRK